MAAIIKVNNGNTLVKTAKGSKSSTFCLAQEEGLKQKMVLISIRNSLFVMNRLWEVVRYKSFNKKGQYRNTQY